MGASHDPGNRDREPPPIDSPARVAELLFRSHRRGDAALRLLCQLLPLDAGLLPVSNLHADAAGLYAGECINDRALGMLRQWGIDAAGHVRL
jgi:hypothetical protein